MQKNEIQVDFRQNIKIALLKLASKIHKICHSADSIAPPAYLSVHYGDGSFFEVGLHFFRHLLDLCNLQRNSCVLDVGCGIGRMALPLTAYLQKGSYEGFDIMPVGIDYCSANITPKFENFRFTKADIFNSFYNPRGTYRAEEYRFPYPDQCFDIVFSTSLITHLPPAAVQNYLNETARVLKPGGKCLHTCFALDNVALDAIEKGTDCSEIKYQLDGFMTSDLNHVEAAIGIPDEALLSFCDSAGLTSPIIHRGWWSRRQGPTLSYQDILVASKST